MENYFKQQRAPQLTGAELIATALIEANSLLEEKNRKITELKPKAEYFDKVMTSQEAINITQIAKTYGMTANEMNKKLHELGIQYKSGSQWVLYKKYHNKGYTRGVTYQDRFGESHEATKWTQRGKLFLYSVLKRIGLTPLSLT